MKVSQFEAETMIRSLANEWHGLEGSTTDQPNFLQFRAWLKRTGFGYLLNSRDCQRPKGCTDLVRVRAPGSVPPISIRKRKWITGDGLVKEG